MDIQIDNQFNLLFKNDLVLTNGINEQKQRLFLFLKTPKGSLQYAPSWGFDYVFFTKFAKTSSLLQIETYFSSIIQELKIDVIKIKTIILKNAMNITFYFPNDTLDMEIAI
ncbi:hypothetical protein bcCo53_001071 (plasmid) [Borrelia coriaceae]|uniref:Uncharacterized protein n=1 Tax=Borrelia coriaceae ATCC 43381 TaxID=1408429 RepID=W5T2G6_9SPIR|nr:hypothetical protein [Borrelia coriaceae]AHH11516.1 Hypothetical protein BCO_0008401 [Borrelia coriaceae ATCC 43381]UPA16904.1 hypothetical protein bcCo53_001071 [Borrelia coriaceae]